MDECERGTMTGEYLRRVAQRKQIPWRKVVVKARKTAVGLGAALSMILRELSFHCNEAKENARDLFKLLRKESS